MIRYLKNSEIDTMKWDNCIRNSINGLIYAYSWYLDTVCDDWDALIEDDYKAVFPLTFRKKFGLNYLYQPPFIQQLGVFSSELLSEEKINEFISNIPRKFKLVEININKLNKVNGDCCKVSNNLTHEIDLIKPYEQLYNAYSSNTKRNIKKAVKKEVSIVENIKPESVIDLFKENRGKDIKTLSDKEYDLLKRLIYLAIYKRKAKIIGAFDETNSLCAGAFFVEANKKAIFLFSGTSPVARENGAMSLIIDTFIKNASQQNLTLDFEGSNDPNLARFYKSFGSKECIYNSLRISRLVFPLNIVFKVYKKIKG
jgi:hypothetical protein